MTVNVFLDPAAMPNRSMDQQTFDNAMAALMQNLPVLASQINLTEAGMNSVAAGGAYAIPYTFKVTGNIGSGGGIAFDGPGGFTLSTSTVLLMDRTSAAATGVTALLDVFDDSTSAVKGHIRIQKQGDPSKWLIFALLGATAQSGYYYFNVSAAGSSAPAPFAVGDALLVYFQRTGDKGDTGSVAAFPNLYVRHEVVSGAAPDTVSGGVWITRTINMVKTNNISGASLASSAITLPAGTYEYVVSVPSYLCNQFRARLYNNTDAAVVDYGTPEVASSGASPSSARSLIRGQFTISATKALVVQHYQSVTSNAGAPAGVTGVNEIYTEAHFRKIA